MNRTRPVTCIDCDTEFLLQKGKKICYDCKTERTIANWLLVVVGLVWAFIAIVNF